MAPPEQEPSDAEPGPPEAEVAAPQEEFSDLPMPPTAPPVEESVGKVLGGTRKAAEAPSHLPAYKETIVVGGDPNLNPPPPPEPVAPPPAAAPEEGQPAPPPPPPQPQAPPPPAIDKEIIAKAEAEAQQIVQNAHMQAQQTMQEATAQAQQAAQEAYEQAKQQGHQEGLQAGMEQGRQAGQVELQERIHHLKAQFIDMVKLKRKIMVDMEPEIVTLAWEVAKRVVGEELKTNREVIVGIVRSSLMTLQERDEILIRVNPAEYEVVKEHQTALEAMIEGLKKFVIQPDGAIEAGSCAIETNLGNVDARIETQFEAIRLGLEEMTKIRQFEKEDMLTATPVEVPGDPEFEARNKGQDSPQPPPDHGGHGHGHAEEAPAPPSQEMPPEAPPESPPEDPPEAPPQEAPPQAGPPPQGAPQIQLVPDLTQEQFNGLSPEDQQAYVEAYQQQQAALLSMLPEGVEPLPELTQEQFEGLSPEDQQAYVEAYQQQQAYLEQIKADLIAQQQGGGTQVDPAMMEQTQMEQPGS